jgi:hypothetical protein
MAVMREVSIDIFPRTAAYPLWIHRTLVQARKQEASVMNTMDIALNRQMSAQNTMNSGRQTGAKVLTFYVACFVIKLKKKTLDRNL